jgi:hypothetical protein
MTRNYDKCILANATIPNFNYSLIKIFHKYGVIDV